LPFNVNERMTFDFDRANNIIIWPLNVLG
jgi:hypothetical protein